MLNHFRLDTRVFDVFIAIDYFDDLYRTLRVPSFWRCTYLPQCHLKSFQTTLRILERRALKNLRYRLNDVLWHSSSAQPLIMFKGVPYSRPGTLQHPCKRKRSRKATLQHFVLAYKTVEFQARTILTRFICLKSIIYYLYIFFSR